MDLKRQSSYEESFNVHLPLMKSFLRLGENLWRQLLITVVEIINYKVQIIFLQQATGHFLPFAQATRYYQVKTQLDVALCC